MGLLSIRVKLVAAVSMGVVLTLGALIAYTSANLRTVAVANAESSAMESARSQAGLVRRELNHAMDTARTLAQAFSRIDDPESPLNLDRDAVSMLLRTVLEENPSFLGVFTVWEPLMFDNLDDVYAGFENHDQTGRFIPHWTRDAEGHLLLGRVEGYDEEGRGEFYLVPKRTGREILTAPHVYASERGESTLLSLVAPVMPAGEFHGVVGVTLPLEAIQRLIDNARTSSSHGRVCVIANNGVLAGVSGQPELAGRRVSEAFLDETGLDSEEVLSAVSEGRELIRHNDDVVEVFAPIRVGRTDAPWSLSITIPTSEVMRAATRLMWRQVTIGSLMAALTLLILVYVAGRIVRPVKRLSAITRRVAEGDLNQRIRGDSNDEVGQLARDFEEMLGRLRAEMEARETFNWAKSGQAQLSEEMRGEQALEEMAGGVTAFLARHIHAEVGAFFLANGGSSLRYLTGYAYGATNGSREEFAFGEGAVGQVALDKTPTLLRGVSADHIKVTSGLGETDEIDVLLQPLVYQDAVKGVLEFGSVRGFGAAEREFLEQVAQGIAVAVNTAQSRARVDELLRKTQEQAARMRTQQEELRQANEKLEQRTKALEESEYRLQQQQEELQQTNEELEERTWALEEQRDQVQNKNYELENARRELEDKAEQLALASRYKSEFLANMSHELRTPLNSMLILSQVLHENRDGNLSDKQVESAKTIHGAGRDLLALINEILDLSKVEAGRMELDVSAVNLAGFVESISRQFEHVSTEKGIEFTAELAGGVPVVLHSDRQRIEQIVRNLLSNAFKFTEIGWVRMRISRAEEIVSVPPEGRDRYVVAVSVSDSGIGIPKDKQRLVFEPFHQADGATTRKYGGTGLGLSISREFARLLGGEIILESEEGAGSTFTLFLPDSTVQREMDVGRRQPRQTGVGRTAGPAPLEKAVSPAVVGYVGSPKTDIESVRDDRRYMEPGDKSLLIIEDDARFAAILADLAREKGFKCLLAGEGETGLHLADYYRPSAIVLDIGLPGMDGMAVMARLKDNPNTRHIPVDCISASDKSLDALRMGAIDYLTKPVTMEELSDAFAAIENTIAKSVKGLLVAAASEQVRRQVIDIVGGKGVATSEAATGAEAEGLLLSGRFDCMVMDIDLGDMSALDLLEAIRQNGGVNVPVIIYAGRPLSREEAAGIALHSESLIVKTVESPERLLDETVLFLHRVESELPEQKRRMVQLVHDKESILRGRKILLVDDDMRNVFALSSILGERGMLVRAVKNGQEGVETLLENPDTDLVLMDIMMPEMDGYEAIREIRKEARFDKLPIIALTAKAMKGDRHKCMEAGASDYIAKPVDVEKLVSLLRVWLYRSPQIGES